MKKLQPKVFSAEEREKVLSQISQQEETRSIPKSTDPKNYPVFDIPVNAKALIYVPNHVVLSEDGVSQLRMDTPLIHSVRLGKRYMQYRCIDGLSAGGYSGTCPFCDATDECFELANFKISEQCSVQGLSPEDKDNKSVKAIRSSNFSDMVIKQRKQYYVFPIVVFETANNDGKTMERDENGSYKVRPFWYVISESQYNKVWKKALDNMEDEPTHPGGHCFLLNYTGYEDKMQSAANLQVAARNIKGFDKMAPQLDKLTESWDPDMATKTVIAGVLYEEEDLKEVVEEVMENTRNMIAVYNASKAGKSAGVVSGGEPFKLEKQEEKDEPVKGLTTDMDDDIPIE